MNKAQLIDELAGQFDGNRRAAQNALEAVIGTITRQVAKGEPVAITGFGKFERRIRPAGKARNPQTGAVVKTKKKSVPKFTPGAEFKAVVNGEKKLACSGQEGSSQEDHEEGCSGQEDHREEGSGQADSEEGSEEDHCQEGHRQEGTGP